MADETATISDNTTEPTEQATTPTPAPTPASAPKPHAPSPAAFAKKAVKRPAPAASASSYSDAEVKAAEAFGRVDDNGTVYVREGDSEREVGQFPDVSKEEALSLYARRYLDLKAKLDLLASRLHSDTVKSHEIDETLKSLEQETDKPAAVGDMAALKQQFEQLKEAGAAKKAELTKARKAAIAKAVEERTKIVEKAEALASSLDDEINWRSTADKFRSLFDQWQQHQRTSVHIDKPQADALWKRFSAARTTFNQARRKWSQARDVERAHAKAEKEAIIAEANQLKDSTAWGETSRRFNELMDRWKRAGRVGRSDDDALWAQFRKAADEFFNARQADRDQISTSEKREPRQEGGAAEEGRGPGAPCRRGRREEGASGAGSHPRRVGSDRLCAARRHAPHRRPSRRRRQADQGRRGRRVEEDRSGGRRPQVQLRGAADRSARRA